MQPMTQQQSFLPPMVAQQPSFAPPAMAMPPMPAAAAPVGVPQMGFQFGGAPPATTFGGGMQPMFGGTPQLGGFEGLGGGLMMPQLGGGLGGGLGFAPPRPYNQPISQLAMAAPGLTLPSMSMMNLPVLPGIGAPVPTQAQPLTGSFQPPPLPAAPMVPPTTMARPNYYAPQGGAPSSFAPVSYLPQTASYAPATQAISTAPYNYMPEVVSYAPESYTTQGAVMSYAPETLSAAPVGYAPTGEPVYTEAAPQIITYTTEGAPAVAASAAAPIGMNYTETSMAYAPSTVYTEQQGLGLSPTGMMGGPAYH